MSRTLLRAGAAPLLTGTWLLIRLRLRRLLNMLQAVPQIKKKAGARTGNAGKSSNRVVMYLAAPLMLVMFGSMSFQQLNVLHLALDPVDTFWRTVEFSPELLTGVAFLLLLLWVSSLLITVASGELAKSDWDLEWLITLPIRSDTLLWARVLERSVVQPSGLVQLGTACFAIAWCSGFRWLAPLVALLAAWPLMVLAAVARTLIDTGLRLKLRPAQLRNLQAILSVLSLVVLYLALSLALPNRSGFMTGIAADMPQWLRYTPAGLAVLALNERTPLTQLGYFAGLLAQTSLLTYLGMRLLRSQLRHGVIAGSQRETARSAAAQAETGVQRPWLWRLNPVQRRELTLLSRDRNFLVQSLVLPLLLVGGQLLLGNSNVMADMWSNPNVLASVAFGLAAYSLSMSAFQTLNTEGHALWLLYTFPRSIEQVLRDKARLWGLLTLVYPLTLFAVGAVLMPALDWKFFGAMATALLGIPIYAFIAVALGVFASRPLEQQQSQKVSPAYLYLYMMLSALYIYAVVTPDLLQRLVFIVLSALLAFALWQKARDQLPYLLDPDVAPPPRVSLSDGLIAAMVFFVLQGVMGLAARNAGANVTGGSLLIAFVVSGGLTYLLMRWVYARARTQDVPRMRVRGSRPMQALALGLASGALATGYVFVLLQLDLPAAESQLRQGYPQFGWWLLGLAVIAAPLFEEFIFRGLIFGGLRRSFDFWPAAVASAALFSIMHPTVAMLPVFVMGICAAFMYDRTRSLLAPMLTHAVYNACVIGAQPWLTAS